MSPLDSPAVRQRPFPATDDGLHGETLSGNSAEVSSSLLRGILYATPPSVTRMSPPYRNASPTMAQICFRFIATKSPVVSVILSPGRKSTTIRFGWGS